MKKKTLSIVQAIAVWWLVFYILIAAIAFITFSITDAHNLIQIMVYVVGLPVALMLSLAFYLISFKIATKGGLNKYYKYLLEFADNNTLSETSVNELILAYETEIDIKNRNDIIFILASYYISKKKAEKAIEYLKSFNYTYDKEIEWSVSTKQTRVNYVLLYMTALLYIDDLNGAKQLYNDWIDLLNEFIDEDDEISTRIRYSLAEYHLNFLDGVSALALLDSAKDFGNRTYKLLIASNKSFAYKILKRFDDEKRYFELALSLCEKDLEKESILKMSDELNKRINEFIP